MQICNCPLFCEQPFSEKQRQLRLEGIKVLKMESLEHLTGAVNDNLSDLVQMIAAQEGKAFNPKLLIKRTLINVILTMVRECIGSR